MNLSFSSQPKSVHGAGTVRHWAAVDVTIAPCRHNVSARDGGITASRRSGAGGFSCYRPSGPFPECTAHNHAVHSFSLHSFAGGRRHASRQRLTCIPRIGCGGHPASFFLNTFSKYESLLLQKHHRPMIFHWYRSKAVTKTVEGNTATITRATGILHGRICSNFSPRVFQSSYVAKKLGQPMTSIATRQANRL